MTANEQSGHGGLINQGVEDFKARFASTDVYRVLLLLFFFAIMVLLQVEVEYKKKIATFLVFSLCVGIEAWESISWIGCHTCILYSKSNTLAKRSEKMKNTSTLQNDKRA